MKKVITIELEKLPKELHHFELSRLIKAALYTQKELDGKVLEIRVK